MSGEIYAEQSVGTPCTEALSLRSSIWIHVRFHALSDDMSVVLAGNLNVDVRWFNLTYPVSSVVRAHWAGVLRK